MAAPKPPSSGSNPADKPDAPDDPDGQPAPETNFKWAPVETRLARKTSGLTSNRKDKPERRKKIPLGQMLIQAGILNDDQLEMALAEQRRTRGLIGESLVGLGFATERDVAEAVSRQTGVPFIDVKFDPIPVALLKIIPEEICRKNRLLPLIVEGSVLRLAMSNPFDVIALDYIRTTTGLIPFPSIATWGAISKAIEHHFITLEAHGDGFEELIAAAEARTEDMTTTEMAEGGPLLDLFDKLIAHAVDEHATDIHIEPEGNIVRTRYRIDSVLHPGPTLPKKLQIAIAARCKVMAGLNLAESRVPQDGRIRFMHKDRRIDLRVSTFLCNFGENIVMRILDKGSVVLTLASLGLLPDDQARLEKYLNKPHGIILVTGPTGSGKTTTLYASLAKLNTIDVNIMTIEDPIEYELNLVRQSQINVKAGVTFASGLRALLRQDPDIILIGEMRDTETAQMAVRAAMTGHLVFSTLHTNTAIGAVNRLIDMGVDPLLVSDTVIATVGQRLGRLPCPLCHIFEPAPEYRRTELEECAAREKIEWDGQVIVAKGCPDCKGRGYKGRGAIYEFFEMTHAAQTLIMKRKYGQELATLARSQGMRTMYEDGLRRVVLKKMTVNELDRVIDKELRAELEDFPMPPPPSPEGTVEIE